MTAQADGVWRIHFLSGATVLLDNEDWQGKLDRFIRAYPKTNPDLRKFAHVFDLRYSNGFVIKQKNAAKSPGLRITKNSQKCGLGIMHRKVKKTNGKKAADSSFQYCDRT